VEGGLRPCGVFVQRLVGRTDRGFLLLQLRDEVWDVRPGHRCFS
jgi:hypothetical protein